jgi:hypothetical protein
MGIREYGRHRNVSHVAVLKALRTGRINSAPDGLIDSDQADRDWAANMHPAPHHSWISPAETSRGICVFGTEGIRLNANALSSGCACGAHRQRPGRHF